MIDDDDMAAVKAYLEKLAAITRGESQECLDCGAHVDRYVRHAPCVYAEPCGHRQYNGRLSKAMRS